MNNEENVLKEYINLTKRNTCKIDFNLSEVSILDDKIGGIPYLPKGKQYPVDKDGNKMGLFMQINLDNLKLDNFPQKGILEIFISTNEKIFEYETDGNIVIKVYDSGLEYQDDLEYIPLSFLGGTYKITTEIVPTIRSLDDKGEDLLRQLINKYNIKDMLPVDFSSQIRDIGYVDNYIGGYPNIGMHDANQSDISNEDECLFFIGTDNFIDMGAVYAMFMTINKYELKEGIFDNAQFNISFD
jgi:uncharacterized protein YwqG